MSNSFWTTIKDVAPKLKNKKATYYNIYIEFNSHMVFICELTFVFKRSLTQMKFI